VDGRILSTSASIGASLYPDHAADPDALLRAADVALFRAKELGRNRFAFYRPALYDAAAQRFRLEQSLRRAVEAGDLMLMYQHRSRCIRATPSASKPCCAGVSRTAASPPPLNSFTSREDRTHPRAHRLGAAHRDAAVARWRQQAGTTPARYQRIANAVHERPLSSRLPRRSKPPACRRARWSSSHRDRFPDRRTDD